MQDYAERVVEVTFGVPHISDQKGCARSPKTFRITDEGADYALNLQ